MSTKITTDIYFAAALLALGAKLDKTDKTDPRHMEFHFSSPQTPQFESKILENALSRTATSAQVMKDTMDLDGLETEWVNKSMKINAFEFAEAIKRMKSVVHSRQA